MTRENAIIEKNRNIENSKSYYNSVIEDMKIFYNNNEEENDLDLFNYFLEVSIIEDKNLGDYDNNKVIRFLKAWGGPSYEFRYNPLNKKLNFVYMDWGYRQDKQILDLDSTYDIIMSVLNQVTDIEELYAQILESYIEKLRS